MYGYIYKTTNLIDGKIYIGQHKSETFDYNYLGSGKLLKRAVKLYGKLNFEVTLLEWCSSKSDLDTKERLWIKELNSINKEIGYNILLGGQDKYFTGCKHTEESKHKMSERAKHREHPPTTKGRICITNGIKNKMIYSNELEHYLELDWVVGKTMFANKPAWNKGLSINDDRIKHMVETRKSNYGYRSWCKGNNPRYKSDEYLFETIINNGLKEIFNEFGRQYTKDYYKISFKTLDRCLQLANIVETEEHKLYIRNKNRKLKNKK